MPSCNIRFKFNLDSILIQFQLLFLALYKDWPEDGIIMSKHVKIKNKKVLRLVKCEVVIIT
jgi:hypothetical protein